MKFRKKYRKVLIGIVCIIFIIIIGGLVYVTNYVSNIMNSMQKIEDLKMDDMTNPNISDEAKEVMEGYWTIALFGVDSRDGDLGKGTLADVQIICNIDRKTGEIRLLSIYRDSYLKISDKDKYSKINDAYLFGGPTQALTALSENLDLSFDDCVAFNWSSVAETINILGGIDIEITDDEFKQINGYITETVQSTGIPSFHLKKAGLNHLDGVQAVAYSRLRKLDTDFKRTERQRTVIAKVLEKAKKADFAVLNNIMVTVLPQIKSTITLDDLIPMAKNITRYHIGESEGFPFDKADKMISGKDCVVPVTLESNVIKLHEFLFEDMSYKPSKKVIQISDKIEADAGKQSKKSESKETEAWKSKKETETAAVETSESAVLESTTAAESTLPAETTPIGPGYRPAKPSESSSAAQSPGVSETSGEGESTTAATEPEETPGITVAPGNNGGPGMTETTGAAGNSGTPEVSGTVGDTQPKETETSVSAGPGGKQEKEPSGVSESVQPQNEAAGPNAY